MPLDRKVGQENPRTTAPSSLALIDRPCAEKHHCQKNSDHSVPGNISKPQVSTVFSLIVLKVHNFYDFY